MTGHFVRLFLSPSTTQQLQLNLDRQTMLAFHTDPRVAGLRFMGKQTHCLVGFGACLTLSLSASLFKPPPPLVFLLSRAYPQLASLLIQTYLTVLTKTFWVYYQSRSAMGFAL